jgi:hypothetical protein
MDGERSWQVSELLLSARCVYSRSAEQAAATLNALPHLGFSVDVDSSTRVSDTVVVESAGADVGLQVQHICTRKPPARAYNT